MPRRRTVAIVALGLLLAVAPFLPSSRGPESTIRPSRGGQPAATPTPAVGPSVVTPAMQAEIDRVVAEGLARPALRSKPGPAAAVGSQVRCATFEGQRYCLHLGWTHDTEEQVQARLSVAARRSAQPTGPGTGDLDVLADLQSAAQLAPEIRAADEREELTQAARAVAKVWQLRHEIEGVPYPPSLPALQRPRASASASPAAAKASGTTRASASASASTSAAAPPKTAADYPRRHVILDPTETAEQIRSYWCGPTSMQMIAWGWRGRDGGQTKWARRLGTTTSGTDISAITRVVNEATGWDRESYAGPYITLDIGDYGYRKWYLLVMRHLHDYRAPIVMHPILLKRYFPYLDDDASGHFQVGRGYNKRGARADLISYFEPWNQQRFDPSEPFISRVQWRSAYKSFRANKAHPYHNIGV